eukprot:497703_1
MYMPFRDDNPVCIKTCTAIGRYYAALGLPYDKLFSEFCYGNDMYDDECLTELEEDPSDCILTIFDDNFPFAREPHNDDTRLQFIFLLIKKCSIIPTLLFQNCKLMYFYQWKKRNKSQTLCTR